MSYVTIYFQINVVDFLRKVCGFDYSEEEIFRVIGLLRTNALQIQVLNPIQKQLLDIANYINLYLLYSNFS